MTPEEANKLEEFLYSENDRLSDFLIESNLTNSVLEDNIIEFGHKYATHQTQSLTTDLQKEKTSHSKTISHYQIIESGLKKEIERLKIKHKNQADMIGEWQNLLSFLNNGRPIAFPGEAKRKLDKYRSEISQLQEEKEKNTMPPLPDFKKERKAKGLTLRQVEKATGISNAYLSQLETGKIKSPSFSVVKKLYDLYNLGS